MFETTVPIKAVSNPLTELLKYKNYLTASFVFPNRSLSSSKVFEVKVTSRLKDSPAIISSHESGALRKMMRMVEQQNSGEAQAMAKQKIEINPK